MDNDDLLSREALAERLGVSVETIKRWQRAGLPVVAYGRKVRLYRWSAVIEWMEAKAA